MDVPSNHPYFAAIEEMGRRGIVSGYELSGGKREFRPQDQVFRAQFAKMVDGVLGIPVSENMSSPFVDLGPDLEGNLYPHEFVAAAFAHGIIQGFNPTVFGPFRNVSRGQAVTMVVRGLDELLPGKM
jgi:hypothetical protein